MLSFDPLKEGPSVNAFELAAANDDAIFFERKIYGYKVMPIKFVSTFSEVIAHRFPSMLYL